MDPVLLTQHKGARNIHLQDLCTYGSGVSVLTVEWWPLKQFLEFAHLLYMCRCSCSSIKIGRTLDSVVYSSVDIRAVYCANSLCMLSIVFHSLWARLSLSSCSKAVLSGPFISISQSNIRSVELHLIGTLQTSFFSHKDNKIPRALDFFTFLTRAYSFFIRGLS